MVYERIAKVAKQFLGVSVLDAGYVLADEQVPPAVRRRVPFVLASPELPGGQCVDAARDAARAGRRRQRVDTAGSSTG